MYGRGRGSSGRGSGAGGRGGSCFKCGQPGHWAPQCPLRATSAPALPAPAAPAPAPASYASDRIDLNCPFAEKDQARALGAHWDPAAKKWYVSADQQDVRAFVRWLPPAIASAVRALPPGPPPIATKPWVRLQPAQTLQADGTPMDEAWVDDNAVTYGTMSVHVVGCEHYEGVIHSGKLANLVRQPTNQ